ncbi:hypothetical protein VOLCADRAFT_92230 [Volvox carteri f. nagariensis]|uniref:Uncharacterized protein n=1 Tax=Volvox carteri f. nagariensis TaxID=3068 RepID=D8TZ39_VOLCA|nr:uncharacterized protein VOLCADRAFT_92230 [Volvox carteri f. nagariensis]EFJ47209.1 hypothetical protein VOLCADRAFT_92230 [Volvox carteri f. nagariensis]|eukprot:XP_002951758.1 hypothetical protein VOLCADRAFT_92230 [Volvox carteri f. nagariensis]
MTTCWGCGICAEAMIPCSLLLCPSYVMQQMKSQAARRVTQAPEKHYAQWLCIVRGMESLAAPDLATSMVLTTNQQLAAFHTADRNGSQCDTKGGIGYLVGLGQNICNDPELQDPAPIITDDGDLPAPEVRPRAATVAAGRNTARQASGAGEADDDFGGLDEDEDSPVDILHFMAQYAAWEAEQDSQLSQLAHLSSLLHVFTGTSSTTGPDPMLMLEQSVEMLVQDMDTYTVMLDQLEDMAAVCTVEGGGIKSGNTLAEAILCLLNTSLATAHLCVLLTHVCGGGGSACVVQAWKRLQELLTCNVLGNIVCWDNSSPLVVLLEYDILGREVQLDAASSALTVGKVSHLTLLLPRLSARYGKRFMTGWYMGWSREVYT